MDTVLGILAAVGIIGFLLIFMFFSGLDDE
jgi:hypothetical protein